MAKTDAPAAPPAETPPVAGAEPSEAAELAAAAAGLADDGKLDGDDDHVALERARRQRDPEAYEKAQRELADLVTVRVTKKGDGKISRGRHFGGVGDDHYEQGDTFEMPRVNALELEERSFVELRPK